MRFYLVVSEKSSNFAADFRKKSDIQAIGSGNNAPDQKGIR